MTDLDRTPLKTTPLRQPGQSIVQSMRARLGRDFEAVIFLMLLIGFVTGVNAGLQLSRYLPPVGRAASLWITVAIAAVIATAAWWIFRRLNASETQDAHDRLGIVGERVVADALDDLKRDGYRVFHDVPPEPNAPQRASNFDHVVIGPPGVFVIETKTRSKGGDDNRVVVTPDGRVLINGIEPDRCPLKQAKAVRNAMKNMLERQTSLRDIPVRGVVLFPEWYVEDEAYRKAGGEVWTLSHTAFSKWLRNGRDPVRLSASDIALLASRIEDHIRR